ncbi:hypothetical protein [Motilibacter deserti]|uniref:Integral membrane protein n=1 Tax=Motilibacter deserti TaxID=2714956 RepID=A0ABX0GST9_9ACTN|nr:hypothetical protein [Motilibacter deserti]NHC12796.1 hypothetical protein [Motilibacter deserti]
MSATATAPSASPGAASALRRLHAARSVFAVAWALALLSTASRLGPLAVALLVLYPLVDAAAAALDARRPSSVGALAGLRLNVVISLAAAVAVAAACASGIPAVLRVWGAWAVVAGLVQLAVGVTRRRLGGQAAMVASGALSTAAGASFVVLASRDVPTLANVAGYAFLGGVFFGVSALRLRHADRTD